MMTNKELEKRIIRESLCSYDKRNPDYNEESGPQKKNCFCDNCFYGRTWLAEKLLEIVE